MKYFLLITFSITLAIFSHAQNVGIGTTNPNARLHVMGDGNVARFQSNSSTVSQIIFESTGGTAGYVGLNSGYFRVASAGSSDLRFGTSSGYPLVITTSNNVGIGTTTPEEKLEIASGNIQLSLSARGILLNAADRPLITRGFDGFTSGNYNGVGRWGLFMEPSKLTFGIPNLVGKAFSFSAYETNSAANEVLQVDRVGQVKRPATGNHDLLPVCMGSVSVTQNNMGVYSYGMFNSTGNVTVTDYCNGCGIYDVAIDGISYSTDNFVTLITPISVTGDAESAKVSSFAGKLNVRTYSGNTLTALPFHFVIYRVNY